MDRFYDKVSKGDCWEWQAHRDKSGYGRFRLDGRPLLAHRVSAYFSGIISDLDDPREVHHTCHNPACVNPRHLEAIDGAEHKSRHGRSPTEAHDARRGFRKHMDKMSQIKTLRSQGLSYKKIGEATDMPTSTVRYYLSQY